MTDSDARPGSVVEQPREVRRGHLTQYRAKLSEDDRVRVEQQMRMHRFGSGTSDRGRPRPIWSGSLDEAKRLHQMLELLLYDEDEVNYARD